MTFAREISEEGWDAVKPSQSSDEADESLIREGGYELLLSQTRLDAAEDVGERRTDAVPRGDWDLGITTCVGGI